MIRQALLKIRRLAVQFVSSIVALWAITCSYGSHAAQPNDPDIRWFRDAKFGLFIHWGIYAVPAGQWGTKTNDAEWFQLHNHMPAEQYAKFASEFDPTNFNAQAWADLAKDAGMKYLVITAKHHDGFCMFDSQFTSYNIVKATPYKKDPMKYLAAACAEDNIKLGFFYSLPDWHHPDMPAMYNQRGFHGAPNPKADFSKYLDFMQKQVRELLTHYGPISVMWFDGGAAMRGPQRPKVFDADKLVEIIHGLQPDCLVNNRLGAHGDFKTAEGHIPTSRFKGYVETCISLNDHWGYNKADQNWKSAGVVIGDLVTAVSLNGNLLLNVGPTAGGEIPKPAVKILKEIGEWMKVNGESVYGTSPNPWTNNEVWGCITAKGSNIYLHVLHMPEGNAIRLPNLHTFPEKVEFLSNSRAIPFKQDGTDVLLELPNQLPDSKDSVVVLRFKEKPEILFPLATEPVQTQYGIKSAKEN